ncbi:TetR/AcrR family transcriptional regulator [Dactylosporangium sp. NPDC049140]|jgi:AcrR family transcriptional regulator|uniref:TetR/AcrR family transcriptional regulator n=1 Tax=Dactylosporangium sp. NPDC049140 TaxID=3155647 RepID=UPI0033E7B8CB
MQTRTEPQQQRSRDKRDRVLAAAAALLQEVPYDEIGTRQIADRAEVSVGSLYRFFPDKDAIFSALSATWLDKVLELMDAQLAAPPPTIGTLVDRIVEAFAEFFRAEPGYRQVSLGSQALRMAPGAGAQNDEQLAGRLRAVLTGHYGVPDDGALGRRLLLVVRLTEFMLNQAFRTDPGGDPWVLAELKVLLRRYMSAG